MSRHEHAASMIRQLLMKKKLLVLFFAAVPAFVLLYCSAVDITVTPEDRFYARMIMQEYDDVYVDAALTTYEEEIDLVHAIQMAVLRVSKGEGAISKNSERNPKDLYFLKRGACHDRSYVIEKILRSYGFRTRHISSYAVGDGQSSLIALLTPGTSSHAVSEVMTQKGWLVVDSNSPWLSLDSHDNPISIEGVRRDVHEKKITWNSRYVLAMNEHFRHRFTYVIGLYSRHGKFYPPYNAIPDINWREFIYGMRSMIPFGLITRH